MLHAPLDDPLAVESIAVHSRGFERFLGQALAHHLGTSPQGDDGIAIGLAFPFPGRLLAEVVADASELPRGEDPWHVDRIAWSLLGLVSADPSLAADTPLASHLTGDGRGRLAAVRRLADRFDRYAVHRPGLLQAWARGARAEPVDQHRAPLPPRFAWQAGLWRALRDRVVATTGVPSPAERLPSVVTALTDRPELVHLPDRVHLFGLTALPATYLEVLLALGVHRDVHLYLAHPSPALWDRAAAALAADGAGQTGVLPTRQQDPTRDLPRHPLLRGWARDAREMTVVLAAHGVDLASAEEADADEPSDPESSAEEAGAGAARGTSLLARLQTAIRQDTPPPGAPRGRDAPEGRPLLDEEDRSIELHACHGLRRQVEVLRDVLLARFAADPRLEPRDVVIMTPDVDAAAPLIEAAFLDTRRVAPGPDEVGADELHPGDLRVRIADRSLTAEDAVAALSLDLLGLADARLTAGEVLDLAGRPPVRARFGFDDAALGRIAGWVRELGIRHGLDLDHRRDQGLPTDDGTWAQGLARLLTGVTTADEDRRLVLGLVPYDDVPDGDVELVGRLSEFLVRLATARRTLRDPRPLNAWVTALSTAMDALTDARERPWERIGVDRTLAEAQAHADGHADDLTISAAELHGLLDAQLGSRGGRADQRTGDLTVCGLVPMRSVPHRIVCLLGMDDGAFPRRVRTDGDDLLDHDERVGDRDPRTEDRQLLLDALLAAEDALIVTTSGADERTGDPRPPAVPIRELLDVLDRTAVTAAGVGAGDARTIRHRLHDVDPDNFRPGAIRGWPGILGADPVALAGARAMVGVRTTPPPPFGDPLAPVRLIDADAPPEPADHWLGAGADAPVFELDAVHAALLRPIASFLDARAGLRFPRTSSGTEDELDVELTRLAESNAGRALLADHLDGASRERALALLRGRGSLPPGHLADAGLAQVTATIDRLLAVAADTEVLGDPAPPREVDLVLPGGIRIIGAVDGLVGTRLRRLQFSRLAPSHRLRSWVALLALTYDAPATDWSAVTIGRVQSGTRETNKAPVYVEFTDARPPTADIEERRAWAGAELTRLVTLARTALRRPLPLLTRTSAAIAETRARQRGGNRRISWVASGTKAFDHDPHAPIEGEARDPAVALTFGPECTLRELLEVAADADDPPVAIHHAATTEVGPRVQLDRSVDDGLDGARLVRLAEVLWRPMFDHEQRGER